MYLICVKHVVVVGNQTFFFLSYNELIGCKCFTFSVLLLISLSVYVRKLNVVICVAIILQNTFKIS